MISLVIPIFNEEEIIDALYKRTTDALEAIGVDYEIICIDDGSKDTSLSKLVSYHKKNKKFKVISLSRNFGHQSAILAGLTYTKGDYIAIIDGDLQDPPELIKELYDKLIEGYDIVNAVRIKRGKEGMLKKFTAWAYYRLLKTFSNISIPLDSGDFCMMKRIVLNQLLEISEQSLFLRGLRSWIGFKQTDVKYDREERQIGTPKYTFRKSFKLAYNGFFSFSHFPIKLLSRVGFVIMLFSAIYIIYILIKKIFFNTVAEGFTTLIIAIIFFSSIQLMAIGLIGEYLIRIYDESRKRPLFIVGEKYID